jgi:hypothetical protein
VRNALRPAIIVLIVVAMLFGTAGGVRWARRGGAAARVMAGALMLGLGMGVVVQPPQQGVEQAEEIQDKTGGESVGSPMV